MNIIAIYIKIMDQMETQYKHNLKMQSSIGLHQPLDGVTNPKYKLYYFVKTFFIQREQGTSF
jgi:hypothetical protein